MKLCMLIALISLSGVLYAGSAQFDEGAQINSQEQAFQAFISKSNNPSLTLQNMMNNRFNPILILRCDRRRICTNDFQCGGDGFCGPSFDQFRRCICY
ncbi:hypothetical protein [Marinicella sp. W31]|uniref:hypothetical protein n=1 Tax=Marinicella sp. W31 TaxID=3023713 RepID=UPI00375811D3